MRWWLLIVVGCYAGSWSGTSGYFVGRRVSLPCLDLAVAQSQDSLATGPVIAYTFGNRCAHLVTVDLGSVHAIGRYASGSRPLRAYDPKHELVPLRIEGWDDASEQIEYVDDHDQVPAAICVDVGSVEPDPHASPHWLCFGTWDLVDPPLTLDDFVRSSP